MVNVLFIETSTGFGGSGKYLLELLKRLDRSRFTPVVIYCGEGLNIKKVKSLGFANYQLRLSLPNFKKSLFSYFYQFFWLIFIAFPKALRICRVIKKHSIDVVYLNNEILSHIPSIIAAQMCNKKIICHNHGLRKLTFLERSFVKAIHWFLCVSEATYAVIKTDILTRPVSIVHNGLDIADYKLELISVDQELLDQKESNYCVGIFGRIVEWKGHRIFVRAAAKILSQIKNIKFIIMGDDLTPEKSFLHELKNEIIKLGIQNQFVFTGWKENVMSTIKGLDVVVHPSIEPEPFGLTIIEAMALERPVVASRLGAIPEIITDKEDGLLFAASNTEDLAEKIILLLSNDDLRTTIGKKAREKVKDQFSIDKNVKEIESLLSRISGNL